MADPPIDQTPIENISINDLLSSLYSQAEKNASLNHISNPSENGLPYSQTEVGSNSVNGDNDLDNDSWNFKTSSQKALNFG